MRIAIIGTGISGLAAAHELQAAHDLTIFEAQDHVGGHTVTTDVRRGDRDFAVDAGFIVYNEANYPTFTGLLAELGVETQPTNMSFSVKCERSGVEYCGTSPATWFAQRRNLLRLSFLRMLVDIVRFNRIARRRLAAGSTRGTIGDFVAQGFSRPFVDHYLVPMTAALWSTDPSQLLDAPAHFALDFLDNHGLLTTDGHFEWRVVKGGSREYVRRLTRSFADRIRRATPVRALERAERELRVTLDDGSVERFDRVVVATHSDQALRLLASPTAVERETLGAMPYQSNRAVLHTDASVLPSRRRAWASWNYLVPQDPSDKVMVTYNMAMLQGLDVEPPFCVSLNSEERIRPETIVREFDFQHPLFTHDAVAAQSRWAEVSGADRIHYCGAYWGNGFHEAGAASGLRAARQIEESTA